MDEEQQRLYEEMKREFLIWLDSYEPVFNEAKFWNWLKNQTPFPHLTLSEFCERYSAVN